MAARPVNRMRRRNGATLSALILVVLAMIGLSFASVPLYRMFCAATGFDGTTNIAKHAPGAVGGRTILIRFNADVSPDLPWSFGPDQAFVRVHPGEQTLVSYHATNHSSHPITGSATYNVTPLTVGFYFDKIQCFCFNSQTLAPGESAEFPVTFFVDPAILTDKNTRDIDEITLSYTFFQAKNPTTPPVSQQSSAARPAVTQLGALGSLSPSASNRP